MSSFLGDITMARLLKNAQEIQAEVRRLIHQDKEIMDDEVEIGVPLPKLLLDLDSEGCNWTMTIFRNPQGYMGVVNKAGAEVQRRWNLEV
jgi:hypothetical protein